MKTVYLCLLTLITHCANAQNDPPNLFIITVDGFRWKEVFEGADSTLIHDASFVKDTFLTRLMYWDNDPEVRRKKLLPFFWNVISRKGQIHGNRNFGNKVNVKNPYRISYPGYSEILTGFADPIPILNKPVANRYENILSYLNSTDEYRNKVVSFTSWNIFPFILNEEKNKLNSNSGYELIEENGSANASVINAVQQNISNKSATRKDQLTFLAAKEYITLNHPKVIFLSFGETDESAHHQEYDSYLRKAGDIDRMIAELWYYTETDPFYKGNTTFIITTDHGRGQKPSKWSKHNAVTNGSGHAWVALLGYGVEPTGEQKQKGKIYLNQFASTAVEFLGKTFEPAHTTGKPVRIKRNSGEAVMNPDKLRTVAIR